jgi:hypothetical protein
MAKAERQGNSNGWRVARIGKDKEKAETQKI